jgi:hypothetical protein
LLRKVSKYAHSAQSPVHRCLTIYNVCKCINESILCRNYSCRIKLSKFHGKLSIKVSLTIHSFSKLLRWPGNQGFKFSYVQGIFLFSTASTSSRAHLPFQFNGYWRLFPLTTIKCQSKGFKELCFHSPIHL